MEIRTRGWKKLAHPDWGCCVLVREFFANARRDEYEKERSLGKLTYRAWFRSEWIDYSAAAIRSLLNLPKCDPYHEMLNPPLHEEILETIAIPGARWQRDGSYLLSKHLTWNARVWSQFTTSTILPVDHTYSLKYEDALLIYCIIEQCPINVPRIISEKSFKVANSSTLELWLPYPGLITRLVHGHMPYLIERPIFSGPEINLKEICRLRDVAERDLAQSYKVQDWINLEHLHETGEAIQVVSPDTQHELPAQPGFRAIYHVLGTLLRRVDDVHTNQELIWELDGRVDPRFVYRTELDETERQMMELSRDPDAPGIDKD